MQPDPAFSATITKNAKGDEVRVTVAPFKGKARVDVRTFASWGDSPELRPTRQGVNLGPEQVPALIAALQAALSQGEVAGQ